MKKLIVVLAAFFSVKISHPVKNYWTWNVYKVENNQVVGDMTSQNYNSKEEAKNGWLAYVSFFRVQNWIFVDDNPVQTLEDIRAEAAKQTEIELKKKHRWFK